MRSGSVEALNFSKRTNGTKISFTRISRRAIRHTFFFILLPARRAKQKQKQQLESYFLLGVSLGRSKGSIH